MMKQSPAAQYKISPPEEGTFLHQKLFGFPVPAEILARYVTFVGTLGESANWNGFQRVTALDLDVEAIEYALRRRQQNHPLLQRIQGLSFICEAHPLYWEKFYSARRSRLKAWLTLIVAGFRSIWLLIKGRYLVGRHSLV